MTDQRIQQAIDACRPGGDDLQLPEVEFLAEAMRTDLEIRRTYERSQQFDAAVSRAFHDLPVPPDLAERLLSAIEPPSPLSARDSGSHLDPRHRWTKGIRPRAWAVMGGTLAATAALVGFLLITPLFKCLEPTADGHLPDEVLAWRDAVTKQGWNDNLLAAELHERPLDRAVRVMPRRWCQIQTTYDSRTMVYDLAPPGEAAALVFCIRSKARNSPLPDTPCNVSSTTGGLTLGVWRREGIVYVLMVQGGQRRYREFIETSPLIGFNSRIGNPASLTGKA